MARPREIQESVAPRLVRTAEAPELGISPRTWLARFREEGFESRNVIVVRATSIDVWSRRAELVRRIENAHGRGLARDRSRDQWGFRTA